MKFYKSLRFVWIPIVLQFACIAVVFAVDRPNPREIFPIWIPWTLITMALAAVFFGVYKLATRAKPVLLRCLCTAALAIVGVWILWVARDGGDPLSVYPVRLHGVLSLLYGVLSIGQMIRRRVGMKRMRPSIMGMAVALVVTALAAVGWAAGFGGILGIVLVPGGLIGWVCVYGDNTNSPEEVMGTIISISLIVNAILGLLIGACLGEIQRALEPRKHNKYDDQNDG
jgi:hypothetical protein